MRNDLRALVVTTLLALVLGSACASLTKVTRGVTYRRTAESNYKKGLAELKDENFPEAIKYFHFVKNKFPFSRFATLSELRTADTYHAQEKFLEAIDAYKLFIKFHPTHKDVTNGYVSFRICAGYMEQIPSDWFLVPPSHEKDQGATKDAMRELQAFRRTFKKSKYLPKVDALYRRCIRRLAEHEIYVARFYLELDKPKATILRLETLLKRYPDAGVDPEVMLLLGQTYMKLDKKKKARSTFAGLIKRYPNDSHSAKARLYMRYLAGERD
jgi:outer membrane protein assembly factor BamD